MFWDHLETVLPPDSLRARFAKGTFWSIVGTSISQGLALLGWVVVARVLGQAGFGELAIVQSTVGVFGVVAGLGLGLTATKHVAEFRDSDPKRVGRILALSFVVALISGGLSAIILFAVSPYIADQAIGAPHLAPVLRLGCWLLLFDTLCGVATGALGGFEAFRTIAKVSLVTGCAKVVLMTIGVCYWSLPGAVGAMVMATTVGSAIGFTALLKEAREFGATPSCRDMRLEMPILWKFSIPGCLSAAIVPPVTWITNAMLVHQPGGFAEMGLFYAATRFQAPLRLLGSTTGATLLPILVSMKNRSNDSAFERANILISWFLGALPAIVLITFPEILSVLFGQQ
jgi:O-antigen/teichoic acid export membrane protein